MSLPRPLNRALHWSQVRYFRAPPWALSAEDLTQPAHHDWPEMGGGRPHSTVGVPSHLIGSVEVGRYRSSWEWDFALRSEHFWSEWLWSPFPMHGGKARAELPLDVAQWGGLPRSRVGRTQAGHQGLGSLCSIRAGV